MNRKKAIKFLENSFPPYNKCTVITEVSDEIVAILDYGRNDKIRVKVGYGYGSSDGGNYKLIQTDFI